MKNTVFMHIRISREQHARLLKCARTEGRSVTELIRRAIDESVDKKLITDRVQAIEAALAKRGILTER